jgi:hypothetical protein
MTGRCLFGGYQLEGLKNSNKSKKKMGPDRDSNRILPKCKSDALALP